jgi:hypothetical protein
LFGKAFPIARLVRGHKNPFLKEGVATAGMGCFQQATLDSKPSLSNTAHSGGNLQTCHVGERKAKLPRPALVNEGRVLLIAARLHASLAQERILSKIDSSMICKK